MERRERAREETAGELHQKMLKRRAWNHWREVGAILYIHVCMVGLDRLSLLCTEPINSNLLHCIVERNESS